jgi:hypothetical protein
MRCSAEAQSFLDAPLQRCSMGVEGPALQQSANSGKGRGKKLASFIVKILIRKVRYQALSKFQACSSEFCSADPYR